MRARSRASNQSRLCEGRCEERLRDRSKSAGSGWCEGGLCARSKSSGDDGVREGYMLAASRDYVGRCEGRLRASSKSRLCRTV